MNAKWCTEGLVACEIDRLMLMPGQYNIDVSFGDLGAEMDVISDAISFDVLPADLLGSGRLPPSSQGADVLRGDLEAAGRCRSTIKSK